MNAKVVLAGNNLAAVLTLELLLEACRPADILAIAPETGGSAAWHSSLEAAAREAGVRSLAPTAVNSPKVVEQVREHEPSLFLSVYYTQIFDEAILSAVTGPMLNFHPSLLPRHRGTAPLIWAIVEGDTRTGVTVHHIDRGIDTGNVVVQHPIPIHEDDTGYELHRKTAKLVRATAADIIRAWTKGEPVPAGTPQMGEATSHSRRDPEVNHLDWSMPRARIRDIVRALAPPLPGAYALASGQPLIITSVEAVDDVGSRPKPHGMVELVRGAAPMVWAGDGPLRIVSFLDEDTVCAGEELPTRRRVTEGLILS